MGFRLSCDAASHPRWGDRSVTPVQKSQQWCNFVFVPATSDNLCFTMQYSTMSRETADCIIGDPGFWYRIKQAKNMSSYQLLPQTAAKTDSADWNWLSFSATLHLLLHTGRIRAGSRHQPNKHVPWGSAFQGGQHFIYFFKHKSIKIQYFFFLIWDGRKHRAGAG